jgi:hypothetical protein
MLAFNPSKRINSEMLIKNIYFRGHIQVNLESFNIDIDHFNMLCQNKEVPIMITKEMIKFIKG